MGIQETYATVSGISKLLHDDAAAIIQNLKG